MVQHSMVHGPTCQESFGAYKQHTYSYMHSNARSSFEFTANSESPYGDNHSVAVLFGTRLRYAAEIGSGVAVSAGQQGKL